MDFRAGWKQSFHIHSGQTAACIHRHTHRYGDIAAIQYDRCIEKTPVFIRKLRISQVVRLKVLTVFIADQLRNMGFPVSSFTNGNVLEIQKGSFCLSPEFSYAL